MSHLSQSFQIVLSVECLLTESLADLAVPHESVLKKAAKIIQTATIGTKVAGSGFEEILFQSGLCGSGSIKGILSGKH